MPPPPIDIASPSPLLPTALVALASYVLGSVPFGFLVAKAKGIDIRRVGSRNIGATNVFRTIGKGPGVLTFLLDVLKGYACVAFVPLLVARIVPCDGLDYANLRLAGGLMAVIGHTWSLFLGFKGGKGVATSAGMLIGISPGAAGVALGVWAVAFLLSRYVSVASVLAALALAVSVWLEPFFANRTTASLLTLLAVVVIVRHHANIGRLAHGTESRFSFARARRAAPGTGATKGGWRP